MEVALMPRSVIMLFIAYFISMGAQTETTRKLWDTALLEKKTYRIATPQIPVTRVKADGVVGITVWQLRPAARTDTGERLLVHQGSAAEEWLPSRLPADTRFSDREHVRPS